MPAPQKKAFYFGGYFPQVVSVDLTKLSSCIVIEVTERS